ncbi:hypothetical protein HOE425_330762 [Hoeflea sp. EC-HK425]|nr:hypothetical protein HOE425_330762 [Hoeflea sp. EC-HK425]
MAASPSDQPRRSAQWLRPEALANRCLTFRRLLTRQGNGIGILAAILGFFGLAFDCLGFGWRSFFLAHAFFEALDALGYIAHQFRNLAATEKKQNDDQND